MRKIKFICDKCLKTVGVQITTRVEKEDSYLLPMGYQEWCFACIENYNKDLFLVGQKTLITDDPMEVEKYGKI